MMFFILPVLNLLGFFLGFAPVQGYPRALHFLREDSKGHVFVDFDTYSWPPFTPTTSPTSKYPFNPSPSPCLATAGTCDYDSY